LAQILKETQRYGDGDWKHPLYVRNPSFLEYRFLSRNPLRQGIRIQDHQTNQDGKGVEQVLYLYRSEYLTELGFVPNPHSWLIIFGLYLHISVKTFLVLSYHHLSISQLP
jgi:hypothetical protein